MSGIGGTGGTSGTVHKRSHKRHKSQDQFKIHEEDEQSKQKDISQEILQCTLQLEIEKERTKRESLRLNSLQESINLVKLAVDSQVPPHLIPLIFTNEGSKDLERLREHEQKRGSTSVFKLNIPQQTQFQFHHWQNPHDPDKKKENVDPKLSRDQQHRRNQSEASVAQLRSIYEQSVPQQIPRAQQWPLGSPYQRDPRFLQPGPFVQYPGSYPLHHTQQRSPQAQQQAPPQGLPQGLPQGYTFPQQRQNLQSPAQINRSPSKGKNDVNFLISTPNNPPRN
jgi:hypothetical protein